MEEDLRDTKEDVQYLKFIIKELESELKDKVEPTKKIMLIINSCLTIGDTLYII